MNDKYVLKTIDALLKIINNEKKDIGNIKEKLENEKGINRNIIDNKKKLEEENENVKKTLRKSENENNYLRNKLVEIETNIPNVNHLDISKTPENILEEKVSKYLKDINLDYLLDLGTASGYGYGYGYGYSLSNFDKNPYFISLGEEAKQKYYTFLYNQISNLKKDIKIMLVDNTKSLEIININKDELYPNVIISAPPATGKTTYLLNHNDPHIVDMDWLYLTVMKEMKLHLNIDIFSLKEKNFMVNEYKNLVYSIAEKIIKDYILNENYHKIIIGTFDFQNMNRYIREKVHIVYFLPDEETHYNFAKKRGDISDEVFRKMRNDYARFEQMWSHSPYFHKVNSLEESFKVSKLLHTKKNITQICSEIHDGIDPGIVYLVNKNLKNRFIDKNKISVIHSMDYIYENIGSFMNIEIKHNVPSIKLVINNKLILSDNCRLISKANDFNIIQLNWYRNEVLKMYNTLCETRKVPDINIIQNIGDFPVLRVDNLHPFTYRYPNRQLNKENDINIFSYSISNQYKDIMIPTPDVIKFIHGIEPYKNKDFNHNWDSKIPKAIFRGSVTTCVGENNPRIRSHMLSLEYPDYLDSRLVGFMDYPLLLNNDDTTVNFIKINNLPEIGDKSKFISMKDQLNYKYILHIDGFVSAWRLIYFLYSKSLILKVNSEWKEYYYDLLQPWVHYIPVKEDLSDLIQMIDWCRNNDNICKQIAENAYNFAVKYLNEKAVYDYLQLLLFEYYNPNEITVKNPKYNPLVNPNSIMFNPLPPKVTNININISADTIKLAENSIMEGGSKNNPKYYNKMAKNIIENNYNKEFINYLNR